ncbi:MAG TPA: glycosyltransferase family 4 protein [Candidatus Binatia bacterium]|jgi:glycosyltransferase involved in cell wall biosynthesis
MRLHLVFDHRFVRGADGVVRSSKHYGHAFFAKRYLRAFDAVTILARVAEGGADEVRGEPTEGPGVTLVSLGDWQGPLGLARVGHRVRGEIGRHLSGADAVLLIAPGMLASLAHRWLTPWGQPYGIEVVGDPYDAMAPASMKHPLRPLLRWSATRELRRLCADAAAAAYVTREALQRRYPCSGWAVGVSDVELSAGAFADGPRATLPRDGRRTLVTVGTMAQLYKAQDVLIDAVTACVRDGVDVGLVLVGDGRFRDALERRAAEAGLGDRVRFAGAQPAGAAVRAVLDTSDVFVLPSHQEGLPRAMVEAMARGLPCIGSTVGGIPELLPAEDLVPPGDVAALAARIREVVGDPARLRRMSERNLDAARRYREDLLDEQRLAFYAHLRSVTEARARRVA